VNAGSVKIEVLNGSGLVAQASITGSELTQLGYRVTVSGDAPRFGLETTEIRYAPDSLTDAKQVRAQLDPAASLVEDASLAPSPYNLEVVTGNDLKQASSTVSNAKSVASTTSSTTTAGRAAVNTQAVSPDSSSIYNGVYVPPGRTAGQVPQTCGN
jgi:hypothetical protein